MRSTPPPAGLVWTATSFGVPVFGALAAVNGIAYVGGGDGTLYAFDLNAGALLGSVPGQGEAPEILCSPTLANGVVYVGYNTGSLLAANASTGAIIWTSTTSLTGIVQASPAVADGVLYVAAEDNYLYAFDASSGKQLKKLSVSVFTSSPAVSNGRVFLGSFSDHKVYAFGVN